MAQMLLGRNEAKRIDSVDSCTIKHYIKKRLSNSDLETIINSTNLTIDTTSYALLKKAQPTSAAVERWFSTLSKLLRKDRKF